MFITMMVAYHRAIANVGVEVDYTVRLLKGFIPMSLRLFQHVLLIV